jgi:hypothetical protein
MTGMAKPASATVEVARDARTGHFLPGHKHVGPGRPKGSRNRHTENFLREFADDFERHGAEVIAKVRVEKPDVYLRVAADLLPRQSELDVSVDVLHRAQDQLTAFRILRDAPREELELLRQSDVTVETD